MSVIRVSHQNGAYRATIEQGYRDWCYGFGLTWEAAVVDLLRSFRATLGLDFTIEPPVTRPEPLDGLDAVNADPELAQHAADWQVP